MSLRKPLLLLCAILAIAGCGDPDSVSGGNPDSLSGGDQSVGTGNLLAEQPSGLPEGLRDDVPVYPGMEVAGVTAIEDGYELSGSSTGSVEEIGAFYETAFDDLGWTLDEQLSDTASATGRIYEVTRDDRSITVIMVDNGNGSDIEMRTKNTPLY